MFTITLNGQTKIFKGRINDAVTKEPIPYAAIYEVYNKKGITSDLDGKFELRLKKSDSLLIEISHLNYNRLSVKMNIVSDTCISFYLSENLFSLQDVVIYANSKSKFENTSFTKLNNIQINNLSSIGGEKDVLKALQFTPGVQSGLEGSTGLNVRGGGPDQNLYLIDNMPIYSPSHLFGFLSTFNSDIINNAELIRAGLPANFGGKLSSLVDINTNTPSYNNFNGTFSLGLISSKIYSEIPILKNKGGLLFSFRRSYFDLLTYLKAKYDNENERNKLGFNDIYLKYEQQINRRNVISFNFLRSKDVFNYITNSIETATKSEDISGVNWVNNALFVNYKYDINKEDNLTFFAGIYNYQYNYTSESFFSDTLESSYKRTTAINDISFKLEYDKSINQIIKVIGGFAYIHHIVSPLNIYVFDKKISGDNNNSDELAFFLHSYIRPDKNNLLSIGLRQSCYFNVNRSYFPIEPRINYIRKISNQWDLKTSLSRNIQLIHRIENFSSGLPIETWHASDENLKYEDSYQISTELSRIISKYRTFIGVALYYKYMDGLVDYGNYFSDFPIPKSVEGNMYEKDGTGQAFGLELFCNKKQGSLNYAVSYLLSKSIRKFSSINENKWYPSNFDRRHYLNLFLSYNLNEKYFLTTNWLFSTGQPVTLPEARYYLPGETENGRDIAYYFSGRNNYRLNNYHRLDLSIQNKKIKRNGFRIWELDIYNIYNRENPFCLQIEEESNYSNGNFEFSKPKLKQYYLFPIFPSISYIRKFN